MQQKALVGREAWFSASVPWPPPIPTAHLEQLNKSLEEASFFFSLLLLLIRPPPTIPSRFLQPNCCCFRSGHSVRLLLFLLLFFFFFFLPHSLFPSLPCLLLYCIPLGSSSLAANLFLPFREDEGFDGVGVYLRFFFLILNAQPSGHVKGERA